MTSLADFLLARIAEDEQTTDDYWQSPLRWAQLKAECHAKRLIVSMHRTVEPPPCHCGRDCSPRMPPACATCATGTVAGACDTLRALGLPYADHPDYRQEWRP